MLQSEKAASFQLDVGMMCQQYSSSAFILSEEPDLSRHSGKSIIKSVVPLAANVFISDVEIQNRLRRHF